MKFIHYINNFYFIFILNTFYYLVAYKINQQHINQILNILKKDKTITMEDLLKIVGGVILFTFGMIYVACGLFSPIAIMWLYLNH